MRLVLCRLPNQAGSAGKSYNRGQSRLPIVWYDFSLTIPVHSNTCVAGAKVDADRMAYYRHVVHRADPAYLAVRAVAEDTC